MKDIRLCHGERPCTYPSCQCAGEHCIKHNMPIAPSKPLTHGHREDYYLLANARRIVKRQYQRSPNWVIAMELFATGSTSAHQICRDAGIDPDAYKVERAAPAQS
jgi:hypothetical protein